MRRGRARPARSWVAGVASAALLVAGCAGSARGDDTPPASLDPASPRLAAEDMAFDRAELRVGANAPFVLVFENRESVTHNVAIRGDDGGPERPFDGALFAGPSTRWYRVPALPVGTYTFLCDLHPEMRGTFIAA